MLRLPLGLEIDSREVRSLIGQVRDTVRGNIEVTVGYELPENLEEDLPLYKRGPSWRRMGRVVLTATEALNLAAELTRLATLPSRQLNEENGGNNEL
jgi:hypothetical protein